jgi:hypothetical protein
MRRMTPARTKPAQDAGLAVAMAVVIIAATFWYWPTGIPDAVLIGSLSVLCALGLVLVSFRARWKLPWFWFAFLVNGFVSVSVAWLTFSVLFRREHFALDLTTDLILLGYFVVVSTCNFLVQGIFRNLFSSQRTTRTAKAVSS